VEAISDGMRGELAQFGIKVVVIEPGFIITEFLGVADENAREIVEHSGPYAESFERVSGAIQRLRKMAGKPEDIAEVIFKALAARNPRARYAAPGHAKFALMLKRLLPSRVFDYVLSR
jgi:NAD(P)-dependent dehydrogenase (short-subunit alcohol dehydrogenase family)